VALGRLGRSGESKSLAEAFVRRWPGDARAGLLLAPPENGPVDPRLIRPFDSSLPAR
jgi:hypothetical protein